MATIIIMVIVLIVFSVTVKGNGSACHPMPFCSSSLRYRRQSSDISSQLCDSININTACSSSYAQNYVNAISKCGNRATTVIKYFEDLCQKNYAGKYCGEALLYIHSKCSASRCSSECSYSLRQAGCCVNHDPYGFYSQYLTACGIYTPLPCSKSRIRQPTVTSDPSCDTYFEYERISFIAHCNNFNPIVRALSREDVCQSLEDNSRAYCSSRNGQYCLVEFNATSSTGKSAGIAAFQKANRECSFTSNCSVACKDSLISLNNTVGCCLHAFNISIDFSFFSVFNVHEWNECGITLPQSCDATCLKIGILVIFMLILQSLA